MTKQEKNYRCPYCGAAVEKLIGPPSGRPFLSSIQEAIFNIVKKCPDGIAERAIYERVWGDYVVRDVKIVHVNVYNINKKISAWGLRIKGSGGRGSLYRLLKIDDATVSAKRVSRYVEMRQSWGSSRRSPSPKDSAGIV